MDYKYRITVLALLLYISLTYGQTCTSPTTECPCEEMDQIKTINCRYQGLTSIPSFQDTSILYDKIVFTSTEATGTCPSGNNCNNILSLPANAFANLNVKSIDLRNNAIVAFHPNAFSGTGNVLESLYLEGNGAKNPPYDIIAVLNTLKLLHLESFQQSEMTVDNTNFTYPQLTTLTLNTFHQLNSIAANAFSPLTNLEELNLENLPDNNDLQVSAILQLSKLKRIKIWETKIQRIFGSSFGVLNDLQEIHIENNPNLNTIDSNAFEGVNNTVQFLYLRENSLTNSLTFLASMDWPVLTQLNLGYNNFGTILASTFSRTPKLSYLDLSETSLSTIQSSMFQGLTELHTLTLEYNIITSIQAEAFQTTPKLTDLKLGFQNYLSSPPILMTLDANAFDHIGTTLEHLSIGNNHIDQSTFWTNIAKLTNLKNLYMVKIGLQSIPDRAFAENVQLTAIDVSENNITYINQETFYGPRTTLNMINLIGNKIETVDKCALSDFITQPSLKLLDNPVKCDCQLLWLFDWYHSISDNSQYIIQCVSPSNLQSQSFYDLTRTELVCSSDYQEPVCYDAYSTTTTSTTTTTTTTTTPTTTTTTTPAPFPIFSLRVAQQTENFIKLTWSINDRTELTGYKLEMTSNNAPKVIQLLHKEATEYTFENLDAGNYFTFCLILELGGVFQESKSVCQGGQTLEPLTTTTEASTVTPEAQNGQLPIIIGSVVGGVVLISIIIAILCLLLKSNKQKKCAPMTEAVRFTPHPHATLPQQGGTAKRFAKKPDKEGASLDDLSVTMISNGDVTNRDRISAGSYQYLNEKDPKNVNSYPNPAMSNGHYVNNLDDRPLPKAPYSGGATGTGKAGYVNDGFKSFDLHAPETSPNSYSEVKY